MKKKQIRKLNIPAIIVLWFLTWTATQGLFITEILTRLPWNVNISYAIATLWVSIMIAISFALLPSYRNRSLPKSKLLWLYSIPIVLLFFLPQHYASMLNIWVYVPMILVTVFWQDYLTFGVLQPALSTRLSPGRAAALTAGIFILGHMVFFPNRIIDPGMLPIVLAGFVFAFSRRYTGNIYLANIIHTIFYLI